MNLQQKLQAYEARHAPEHHLNSKTKRFAHWYLLKMYSDGSGCVVDKLNNEVPIFNFDNFEQLLEELEN